VPPLDPATPRPPSIELAPGAEENGLATMLADLVRQNIAAKPHKRADFDALHGLVAIVADDADVALTLVFSAGSSGGLTIHDGIVGIPDVTIRGSADTIIALSNMPLWSKLGLPIAGRGDKAGAEVVNGVMTALREGRFHMYGAPFHLPLVMRLTRVMSING
jgi:hypothetical protein